MRAIELLLDVATYASCLDWESDIIISDPDMDGQTDDEAPDINNLTNTCVFTESISNAV